MVPGPAGEVWIVTLRHCSAGARARVALCGGTHARRVGGVDTMGTLAPAHRSSILIPYHHACTADILATTQSIKHNTMWLHYQSLFNGSRSNALMKIKVMICVIWPRHYSCVYPEPGINILILLSISIFPIRMVWSGDWWRGVAGAFLRSITLSQGCGQVFTSCWSAATRSHLSSCKSYFYIRKNKL